MNTVERFGVVYKACEQILIDFYVFLRKYVEAENAFSGAGPWPETELSLSHFFINFASNTILYDFKENFEDMWH